MTTEAPVREGEVLDGKFRIEAVLGKGAMGIVVRATHLALDRTVAIKFLTSARRGEAELRFMREARIAAKLKSQHAAKVIDVGVYREAPFIVMEYLEGVDLDGLIQRGGPLTVDRAVTYLLQACEAVAEAHASGIVHRDIKPANLMLTTGADGAACVKVLDFGVSKMVGTSGVAGTEEARLTATSQAVGSPLYMAPEQVNDSAGVDGRADIWSLGIVLYQLLTETTPWTGTTILTLFSNLATQPPAPIAQYRPDVPPGLAAIIEQCFERDRDRRWPTVAALASALAPYAAQDSQHYAVRVAGAQGVAGAPARPTVALERASVPAATQPPAAVSTTTGATSLPEPVTRRTYSGAGIAFGVGIGLVVALGAFVRWRATASARAAVASAPAALAPHPVEAPAPAVTAEASETPPDTRPATPPDDPAPRGTGSAKAPPTAAPKRAPLSAPPVKPPAAPPPAPAPGLYDGRK